VPHESAELTDTGKLLYFFQSSGKMEDFFSASGKVQNIPTQAEGEKLLTSAVLIFLMPLNFICYSCPFISL